MPSVLPSPRQADTSFLGRLKTAAVAGLRGLSEHYAQMPEYSNTPQGDWTDIFSGVTPAVIGAVSPQTVENQQYFTRTLPMFQEQEKLKAQNRDSIYRGQKADLDAQKTQADIQHTGAQIRNTTAQAAEKEAELPFVSRKASAGASKAEADVENTRKTGINLGLTADSLRLGNTGKELMNETNRRLMPTKVATAETSLEGKKLDNTAKQFKNQSAPEDRAIRNEQIKSSTYRNYSRPAGANKVNVGEAKDRALTEWMGGAEAAEKQKFIQQQISRWADMEGTPEEKAAMAAWKWEKEKEKEKYKKSFIEARSLENRNAQRGTATSGSPARDGKSLNAILNGK